MNLADGIAYAAALAVSIPGAVFALECLAACLPPRRKRFSLVPAPQMVVLVPAHDEEGCLPEALRSIEPELGEGDRVLVVAHNCTDRTAMIARARGAEAIEVRDDGKGGKPAALRAGLAHLDAEPPEIVVIVDADCRVEKGAIRALAMAAAESGGPVQGDYRFGSLAPDEFSSLSSLALLVKNVVRPLGLTRLGLACLLNGAGSAYPFGPLRRAPQGEGSIAEDYQLAIDLAKAGYPPRFVPEARIHSSLPARRDAALRQRTRWEHGHLALVFRTAPALLLRGLFTLDRHVFFLGVDLLVPPLAFLALACAACLGFTAVHALRGGSLGPLGLVSLATAFDASALALALRRFAGSGTFLRVLRSAPGYVLGKLPLYLAFFGRRETRWRKTERTSASTPPLADGTGDERSHTGT